MKYKCWSSESVYETIVDERVEETCNEIIR